jgi:hypothetical protein
MKGCKRALLVCDSIWLRRNNSIKRLHPHCQMFTRWCVTWCDDALERLCYQMYVTCRCAREAVLSDLRNVYKCLIPSGRQYSRCLSSRTLALSSCATVRPTPDVTRCPSGFRSTTTRLAYRTISSRRLHGALSDWRYSVVFQVSFICQRT